MILALECLDFYRWTRPGLGRSVLEGSVRAESPVSIWSLEERELAPANCKFFLTLNADFFLFLKLIRRFSRPRLCIPRRSLIKSA